MEENGYEQSVLEELAVHVNRAFPSQFYISYADKKAEQRVNETTIRQRYIRHAQYFSDKDRNSLILDVYFSTEPCFSVNNKPVSEYSNRIVVHQLEQSGYAAAVQLRNLFFQKRIDINIHLQP